MRPRRVTKMRPGARLWLSLAVAVTAGLSAPVRTFAAEPGGASKPPARATAPGASTPVSKGGVAGKGSPAPEPQTPEAPKPAPAAPAPAGPAAPKVKAGAAGEAEDQPESDDAKQWRAYGCGDRLCINGEGKPLKDSVVQAAGKQTIYVLPMNEAGFKSVGAEGPIVVSDTGQKLPKNKNDSTKRAVPWALEIDVPDEPKSSFTLLIDGKSVPVKLEYAIGAEEVALFQKQRCEEATVVCLDSRSNGLFHGDTLPTLRGGDHLLAVAIGPADSDSKTMRTEVKLSMTEVRSLELLVRPRPSSDAKESGAVKPMLEVKASASSIIGDAEQVRVTMEVTSHDQVEGTDATVAGVFSIAVNQGRYFLDIGIAAVVIPGGSRRVQAETIPGTGDRIAHVDQDWRVDGALMINAFVFGGRRVSGIWYRGENDPSSRGLFGAQVGFNLDLKNPLDQIYLGLFIEPIAGLSLGAGVALVNGQFLTGATGGGTLLAPGAQPQVETNRMLRPYLAITFSSEIIDSAKNVFTTARNAGHE